ncbi:unnamed protein product [Allacma fusca]|uniref:SLIT-ROBO Rho GTPase-activating protein 1-like n=1 Tax=Allacma fusca TaxID=39272 RepID=A0A8J2JYM1_9HEXA|nr:unnamed protein product [Allacma fusca]
MFQCIVQPKNGWTPGFSRQNMKEVFPDLRFQLQEQLRCLDSRVETQASLTYELQDFFRRRAEVELECSRSLDKLAKTLAFRQKELKTKRDQWHLFSVSNCWQQLISETKKQSKEHAVLADIYNTHVTSRLSYVSDDLQRIYKQCKEVGIEAHEELLKVLHELHTSTKTFHAYHAECKQAEAKLKVVEGQKAKLELAIPKEKIERSKKIRLVDKEIQKRKSKYTDARIKALKAKNEYILCMDAANAAVQKYFVDDLSDLIDCMDLGFYQCIARAINMYLSSQDHMKKSLQSNMDSLNKCISSLDSRLDKQKFLEANNSAFIMPKKFEFQAPIVKGEEDVSEPPELESTGMIRQELEQRLLQLHRRLDTLRTESDELWKTLETAESSLLEMLTTKDYDSSTYFDDVNKPKQPEALTLKIRADRHETDEFHLSKFHDYMLSTNRIARLQAKYDHIRKVLGETDQGGSSPALAQTLAGGPQPARKVRRKRIGQLQISGIPRLFGGSLEEYLEVMNQDIPLVMKSCIRVINLYGLHHQGIFRVSGSQVEINNFKDAFERGDDPLADVNDASDINSVAGVLKLYLRELREPLFPIVYFEQFMELAQLESKQVFVSKMKDLVKSLPRVVFIVLRYLFAFLNHLSEFSDENMMDPYNLAICFGPTLVPVPEDKDQVQYQNQVNELIKNVIIYNEDIFPQDGGIIYEKYISKEPDEGDVGDAPTDQSQDEMDSEICPSEDDSVFLKEKDISLNIFGKSEFLEAIAQFDFMARSKREVSFKKGDLVTLYSQVSGDWWKGSVNGIDGLVPDKYIMLKIRDEDKDRLEVAGVSKEEFAHHRNRTASDSFLSTQPKQLSISLSPSLQGGENRRMLGVKCPSPASPQSFLGVSGESLASTSPESPSEFGTIEKEPNWAKAHTTQASTHPPPTSSATLGVGHSHATPTRSMSIAVPIASSTPIASGNIHEVHQRSMSVTEERFLGQSNRKDSVLDEKAPVKPARAEARQGRDTVTRCMKIQKYFQSIDNDDAPSIVDLSLYHHQELTKSTLEKDNQIAKTQHLHILKSPGKTRSLDYSSSPYKLEHSNSVGGRTLSQGHADPHLTKNSSTAHNKSKSEDLVRGNNNKERPNFQSNIQFWEQRSRLGSGHTPDLVMDLPVAVSSSAAGDVLHSGEDTSAPFPDDSSPSSSVKSDSPNSSGAESPDSVVMTAAECFAKANQCTLKKNQQCPSSHPESSPASSLLGHNFHTPLELDGTVTSQEEIMSDAASSRSSNINTCFPGAKTQINLFETKDIKVGIAKPQVKVKPQVLKKPSFPAQLIEKNERKSPTPPPGSSHFN